MQVDAKAVERLFDQLPGKVRDFRPVWNELNGFVEDEFRKQFSTAGSHGGDRWKPLAPATVRSRLRNRGGNRGGVNRPLWDHGVLRASLVGPAKGVVEKQEKEYRRGTLVPYAAPQDAVRPLVGPRMADRIAAEAERLAGEHVQRKIDES